MPHFPLKAATAAGDSLAEAQLKALAEAFNPLPFNQQDIHDSQEAGERWFQGRQRQIEENRFGNLLE
jgi:hypothetical protein